MTEFPFIERFCANNTNECKSKQDLLIYYYNAYFCPTKTIWIKAIKNNLFLNWPGLTINLVIKYITKYFFKAKLHLRQSYKGVRSTKQDPLIINHIAI